MSEEIDILRKQLLKKDEQIEQLQHIINNLTGEENPSREEELEPYASGFWERHITLSYVVLFIVAVIGITVILSPFLFPSLWEGFGSSMQLTYTYSAIGLIGLAILAWLKTPKGRSWLRNL